MIDVPTTIEVISHRSKLERDGSHIQLEHVLDGLAVIFSETMQRIKVRQPETQLLDIELKSTKTSL